MRAVKTGYLPTQNLTGDTGRINEGDLSTDRSIKSISFVTNTEEGLGHSRRIGLDDVITLDTANNGYGPGGHRANKQYVLAGSLISTANPRAM